MTVKAVLTSLYHITLYIFVTIACLQSADAVELYIENQIVDCGDQTTIQVKVSDFDSLTSIQFSLLYDSQIIAYQNGTHDFPGGVANVSQVSQGVLTFLWYKSTPASLSDGHVIFTLVFDHVGACETATELIFSGSPTQILASNSDGEFTPNVKNGLQAFTGVNCSLMVDAGPDQSVCAPGGSVQLNGSVNSAVNSFSWSPAGPLDNPNILNPTATVSQTTTFILTGEGEGPNLIQNWNFEQGNTGFTSEYTYSPNDLTPEGTYAVVQSPAAVHPGFSDCEDHTPGSGEHLMVVNGAGVANVNVWCQTVPINPDTDYEFSAWVGSVHPVAPAELQFSINGQLIGDIFQASGTPCEWEEFSASWTSGGANSATICIVNQNTALSGNDFALDDISFNEVCTEEDEVIVELLQPKQETIDTAICVGSSIIINGQTLNSEGTYQFTLQAANGCDSNLTVNLDVIDPQAVVLPPESLTCDQDIVTLDGTPSDAEGGPLTYEWSTQNGHFVNPPSGPVVQVDQAGTYSLVVHTTQMGINCTSQPFEVTVDQDTTSPVISISSPDSLECPPDQISLEGSVDQSQGNVIISWSTADGNIVSGADGLHPEVNAPGTYTMTVIHIGNGCTSSTSVEVFADPTTANAVIADSDTLSCSNSFITLDGGQSGPQDATFQWSTSDGNIISDPQLPQIDVDSPGTYQLIVEAENGCMDTTEVEVSVNTDSPVFQLTGEDSLTCSNTTNEIRINNFATLSPVSVEWSSPNGHIVNQNDSLIVVDSAGLYIARLTSQVNGCSYRDTFEVAVDSMAPAVRFQVPDTLSCKADTLAISSEILDTTFHYIWMSSNGTILSPPDSPSIKVSTSAWYTLEVTDPSNGCSQKDSLFVPESTDAVSFDLISTGDSLHCNQPEIMLTLTGIDDFNGITITANGPGGTLNFSETDTTIIITEGGLYTVEIEDNNSGCISQETVTIVEDFTNPEALAGADDSLNCQVTTITLNGSGSQGQNLQYEWYAADEPGELLGMDTTIQITEAGQYVLEVTNNTNGCSDRDTVQIYASQNIPTIQINAPKQITCRDSTVTIDASNSDQSPDLFPSWSSPDGQISGDSTSYTVIASRPGIYVFRLYDTDNGCFRTDSVQVETDTISPEASLPERDSINCAASKIQLHIQPDGSGTYSYDWSSGMGGNILSPPDQQSITVDAASDYSVTLTDEENGCTSVYSLSVVMDTIRPVAEAGSERILPCDPRNVELDGSASSQGKDIEYLWLYNGTTPIPGGDQSTVEVSSQGWYLLEVSNQRNGCRAMDSVQVIPAHPEPVRFSTIDARCSSGGAVYLYPSSIHDSSTAEIPSLGMISFGDTLKGIGTGTYSLIVTDLNGCRTDTSFNIQSTGGFEIELPSSITLNYGDSVRLNPELPFADSLIDDIQWTPTTHLTCEHCLRPFVQAEDNISYTLTVTDEYGCSDEATIQIRVERGESVYIPNAFTPNHDGINDFFTLYGGQHVRQIRSMSIFNRWGDLVFTNRGIEPGSNSARWDGTYNGQRLEPGVFVYRVEVILNNGETKVFTGDVTLIR